MTENKTKLSKMKTFLQLMGRETSASGLSRLFDRSNFLKFYVMNVQIKKTKNYFINMSTILSIMPHCALAERGFFQQNALKCTCLQQLYMYIYKHGRSVNIFTENLHDLCRNASITIIYIYFLHDCKSIV